MADHHGRLGAFSAAAALLLAVGAVGLERAGPGVLGAGIVRVAMTVAVLVDAYDPRLATIGCTLAPAAQGKGYATEAVTRLLDHLFVERGKHRVMAECDARNVGSVGVLARVGMRQEAHHVESAWWKGEWTDELVHAVLAREWAARRSSA